MDASGESDPSGRSFRKVVLRRVDGETLEVIALEIPPPPRTLDGPHGCHLRGRADGEMQVYELDLPDGYVVRPPDWRRFALDPDRVRSLIEVCVLDNSDYVVFEPWTAASREKIAARLSLALKDLSSMIEVITVTLDSTEESGRRWVSVEFVDAHRRRQRLSLPLPTDDAS